jgi:hypothetical protein
MLQHVSGSGNAIASLMKFACGCSSTSSHKLHSSTYERTKYAQGTAVKHADAVACMSAMCRCGVSMR